MQGDGEMIRIEFTQKIVALLSKMIAAWEPVIIDYVKRSDEEQKRLFDAGLSKCDGKEKQSAHQSGKAMDIYFIVDGKLIDDGRYEKWHKVWQEKYGGKPMIEWDKCHFE